MNRISDPDWDDFIEGCKRQQSECEHAIEAFRTGEIRVLIGQPNGKLTDVTADHVAQLGRIREDMVRLIAKCEAKAD